MLGRSDSCGDWSREGCRSGVAMIQYARPASASRQGSDGMSPCRKSITKYQRDPGNWSGTHRTNIVSPSPWHKVSFKTAPTCRRRGAFGPGFLAIPGQRSLAPPTDTFISNIAELEEPDRHVSHGRVRIAEHPKERRYALIWFGRWRRGV